MSWTQYSTAASTASLFVADQQEPSNLHPTTPSHQHQLRKSKSYGDFLRPLGSLARVVRDPSGALKSVGEIIWENPTDAAACAGSKTLDIPLSDAKNEARRKTLRTHMENAITYDEWLRAATELDDLERNNVWKLDTASDEYNVALVQSRLKELDEARESGDPKRMLRLIRTSLTRGLGGMGDRRLYDHSHTGTKDLIERYIDSAKETIQTLLDVTKKQEGQPEALDPTMMREELLRSRQSFGRSAVLLSGGGTFGMNHIGVVKALFEQALLPRIVSGASAGSIVCAVLCSKTDEEIPSVIQEFCEGDLEVFEREGVDDGLYRVAMRFLKQGSLFDVGNLIRVMQGLLGNMTFLEAYNRTRRVLNICVSSSSVYETPRLLNYITAPDVMIWSAVAASCSVPLVFSPATLKTKDRRTGEQRDWNPSEELWIDGSVDNDLPMARLAELFNVNHFIVSQVNPHVVPFLHKGDISDATGPTLLHRTAAIAKDEALHRLHVLSELGVAPSILTKVRSILGQKYSGDITIFPPVSYALVPRALKNPSKEFIVQAMELGERATWPKLARIKNHVAIELALDSAVREMIDRAAFSADEVALRRRRLAGMTARHARPKSSVLIRPSDSESALHHSQIILPAHDDSSDDEEVTISRRRRPRSLIVRRPTALHPTFSFTPSPGFGTTQKVAGPTFGNADTTTTTDVEDVDGSSLLSDSSTAAGEGPLSSPPTHDSGDEHTGIEQLTRRQSTHKGKRESSQRRWRFFNHSSSPSTSYVASSQQSQGPRKDTSRDANGPEEVYKRRFHSSGWKGITQPAQKDQQEESDSNVSSGRAKEVFIRRMSAKSPGNLVQGLGLTGLAPAGRGRKPRRD